ncbi:MAG: ATP-binding protein [Actinomycetota bacterium]
MTTTILVLLLILSLVLLAVVWVRYRRLDRDVERILTRFEIASTAKVASRALYRGVRGLERRLEDEEDATSRLRAAAERSDTGVVITDERGEIVYANAAASEVISGRLGDAVAGSRITALLERVQATGREEDLELDLYTPARRILRLRAVPLAAEDRVAGAVGYIQDLSRQRRVEAMRRDFLTNAGHEMKTPLGALVVLAETIADTDDPETRRRLVERMQTEATRMAQVVDDVLTLADIESLETPFAPVQVGPAVAAAISRVATVADEAGVEIVESGIGTDAVVDGNGEQLVSAVANLLDNAVKYSTAENDGPVEVAVHATDDEVAVAVTDHGIGIPPAHVDRIFERFYRVDRGRNRASGGTGLGLSIVRNVASTHGGSVEVASVPTEGSTFTMRLPLMKD